METIENLKELLRHLAKSAERVRDSHDSQCRELVTYEMELPNSLEEFENHCWASHHEGKRLAFLEILELIKEK